MKTYQKVIIYLLLLLTVVTPFVLSEVIDVSEVECRNQYGQQEGSVCEKVASVKKDSVSKTRKDIVYLLNSDHKIIDHVVSYVIPNKLEVSIIENKPEAAIFNEHQDWLAVIGRNGIVLDYQNEANIQKVKINNNLPNKGEQVGDHLLFALRFVNYVSRTHGDFEALYDDRTITIKFANDYRVIIPAEGDIETVVGKFNLVTSSIQVVLDEGGSGDNKIETIDLRFNNPVILLNT